MGTAVCAQLQGADLRWARLEAADLVNAQLQGADLEGAQLQGANLEAAQLQGADLEGAQLEAADLGGARLQGANLEGAELWLASFPADLDTQSPVPLGAANLSPLTTKDKAVIANHLEAAITDGKLLKILLDRLNPILRDDPEKWEDEDKWKQYVGQAKEPSEEEFAQFIADMACHDREGHIARAMASRAEDFSRRTKLLAKLLAKALLDENCDGAKALPDEARATLERWRHHHWRRTRYHKQLRARLLLALVRKVPKYRPKAMFVPIEGS